MKKIINTSNRIVSINGKVVMPDESITVKDEVASLGSVKAVARYNHLKIEDVVETTATAETATTETATTAKKSTKKAAETETVTEG